MNLLNRKRICFVNLSIIIKRLSNHSGSADNKMRTKSMIMIWKDIESININCNKSYELWCFVWLTWHSEQWKIYLFSHLIRCQRNSELNIQLYVQWNSLWCYWSCINSNIFFSRQTDMHKCSHLLTLST